MYHVFVYGDSMSWGIVPGSRRRWPKQNLAWHSSQGLASIVGAVRQAPIEPGMPVAPILIVAPPPVSVPSGLMAEKFAGAAETGRGAAEAYRKVADELGCSFFDTGLVIRTSLVDGIHLDEADHRTLGKALAPAVAALLPVLASSVAQ